MDLDIIKTKNEPLMKRTSFEAKMVFSGKTPSRLEICKDLAKKLGTKEELLSVKKINTNYGSERANINGYYYDDADTLAKLENKHIKMRHLSTAQRKEEKEKIKAAKLAAAPVAKKKK